MSPSRLLASLARATPLAAILIAGVLAPTRALAIDGAVTVRAGFGTVRISGPNGLCTGFLISARIVLTAGHCVTDGANLKSSDLISIKYTSDGVNYSCISSAPDAQGECTSSTFLNWRTPSLPPFNTVEDFAIIYNTQGDWIGMNSSNAIGLTTVQPQVGNVINVMGRGGTVGSNDNKMRHGTTSITAATTRSFESKSTGVNQGRPPQLRRTGVWLCDGDSGGPDFVFASGTPWVVGINSAIESSSRCAALNTKQFHYRIRGASVNLINNTVSTALPSGTPRCVDMSTLGVMPAGYYWCAGF